MEDKIAKLLAGSYDIHLHATPCLQKRRKTVYQLALEAREVGVKGFVVKDHHASTAPHAAIVNEVVPEVKVVGGVTLNHCVGGFNPSAVEHCFKLGGKVVWMPSLESRWMGEMMNDPAFKSGGNYKGLGAIHGFDGYSALVNGTLIDEVKEIIALCKQYNCVFETSHFSKKEAFAAAKEAKEQGLDRFVITHANTEITRYTVEEQKELIEMGATMMYTLEPYVGKPNQTSEDMGILNQLIRTIGANNIVLGTDFGLNTWPSAIEGVRMLIAGLLSFDISENEIHTMLTENPEKLYMD